MLPAASRVRRRPEFTAVTRGGRRCGSRSLVVHLLSPGPAEAAGRPAPGAPARAGFVVGRTVGSAVVRNRVRRRLRHLVAERLGELPAGTMLVVRALPDAADRSWTELGAELDQAMSRCRVRR